MIKAQIVADSLDPRGNRLTSMLITFPRFILAELNTHRMLSKNSASSRAIPFNKMVESVQNNPFIPIACQKDHKGMQGTEYFTGVDIKTNNKVWLQSRDNAIRDAILMNQNKVTKQLCNRLLEPFMWHTVLISGTEWENFFELRCPEYHISNIPTVNKEGSEYHKHITLKARSKKDLIKSVKEIENPIYDNIKTFLDDLTEIEWLQRNKGQAEIHMMALAEAMWDAMNESTPKQLKAGEWHIPFEDKIDSKGDNFPYGVELAEVKIATAMNARTSYTIVGNEKEFTYEQQIALHDRMANAVPFHASPFEHCARVMNNAEYESFYKGQIGLGGESGWCRNYKGFIQYREILENK